MWAIEEFLRTGLESVASEKTERSKVKLAFLGDGISGKSVNLGHLLRETLKLPASSIC